MIKTDFIRQQAGRQCRLSRNGIRASVKAITMGDPDLSMFLIKIDGLYIKFRRGWVPDTAIMTTDPAFASWIPGGSVKGVLAVLRGQGGEIEAVRWCDALGEKIKTEKANLRAFTVLSIDGQ